MSEAWPDPTVAWKKDLWSGEWASGVVKLPQQVSKIDVTYAGACPRCGHTITVVVPRPVDDFLVAEDLAEGAKTEETPKASTASDGRSSCNCGQDHKGYDGTQPKGCGAYAYIYFA